MDVKVILALLSTVAFMGCQSKPKPIVSTGPDAAPLPKVMLLCGGQSNMTGQGQRLDDPFPADPLVSGYTMNQRRGPCYSAAVYLAHQGIPKQVVAVNCAMGGVSISSWVPNGDLYNACIYHAGPFMGPPIVGFIFYQGEADYRTDLPWAQMFTSMVRGFQHDFGSSFPVAFAQLANTGDLTNPPEDPTDPAMTSWAAFKTAQTAAIQPGIQMIHTDDFHTVDGIHLGKDAYWSIGIRLAQALSGD